jgi:hypothetical protein
VADWVRYLRISHIEARPWEAGMALGNVSISQTDRDAGSPKAGDMIARNPKNHADRWLIAAAYFEDNFELVEEE